MTADEPNTPGIAGYVLGILVSFLACAVLLVVPGAVAAGSWTVAIAFVPVAAVYIGILGFPVALAGALIVQIVCFRVPSQAFHVAVSVAAGFGLTAAYLRIDFTGAEPEAFFVAMAVGLAAGIGRAAVIFLVSSRRRLARVGELRGAARW